MMPVFSAEPKLFLTEFGTDHALDSSKSIFSHNRTTLTFLRCSDASGTLVTLTTWSWETTLSEWYGDITPTKDPPRQWGKILILCQPSHSSIPTLLYSPWGKNQVKSPSKVVNLRCQRVGQYCKNCLKYWSQGINGPLDPSGGKKIQWFIKWKGLLVSWGCLQMGLDNSFLK